MEKEEIKIEFTYACRLIAKRIVADVKLYPNSPVRLIVNEYWDNLPYLKAIERCFLTFLRKRIWD